MINNIGIYQIENKMTGTLYIGQSIMLSNREQHHFNSLENNKHRNRYLQRAFNKYGSNNFIFKVILYCEDFELTRYEQALVNSINPVYNICKECVNSSKGIIRSREFLNKMYNHIVTEETKKKISDSLQGNLTWNKGLKGKQIAWNKGLRLPKHSEKQKLKISKALKGHASWSKGKLWTEEQKQKLRGRPAWNKGLHPSTEIRMKMSKSAKERHSLKLGV